MWNVRLSFTVSNFLHLKLSIHYFSFCIVSDEKSAVSLNFVPLYVIGLFGLPSRFTLYLWISSINTCVYGVQFGRRGVIMHGLYWGLWLVMWCLSFYLGNYSPVSLQIFILSPSLFHLGFQLYICHLIVSHHLNALFWFFSLFPFCLLTAPTLMYWLYNSIIAEL